MMPGIFKVMWLKRENVLKLSVFYSSVRNEKFEQHLPVFRAENIRSPISSSNALANGLLRECKRVQRECRGMQGEYSNAMLAHFKWSQLKLWRQSFHNVVCEAQTNQSRGVQTECKMARKLVRNDKQMTGKAWEPISMRREQANDAHWVWKKSKLWRQPFHNVVCEVVIAQTNRRRGMVRECNGNTVTRSKSMRYHY